MRLLAVLLALIPGLAFAAATPPAVTPRDQVTLISATNAPANGQITLALKFRLAPGWHIYWQNPGDAGLAPQLTLAPPAQPGPFAYPAPTLLLQGPVAAYVLSGDVLLPFTVTHPGPAITADANWLVCSDICVPEHAHFTLPLTGGPSAEAPLFTPQPIIPSPFPATLAPDGTLALTGVTAATIAAAHFFPAQPGQIINRAPQPLSFTATGLTLKLTPTPSFHPNQPLPGVLELTDKSGATESLTLTPTNIVMPAKAGIHAFPTLATNLILAFLGGLVLNLMPCVFPILAMKALAIIRLGGAQARQIRADSLGYAAGILTAMLIITAALLALRAAGIQAGWGFQFQSPIFVAIIAWIIFCAGCSLAGAFEVTGLSNFGARLAEKHSFFTGLLAVAVASPCTAPFMGGAVAAALAAPPLAALGIFAALGLGLAAPFILLAALPAAGRYLPRPGSWMIQLQLALAIPMFLTAAWLAWVLQFQAGYLGLLCLALGAAALYLALTRKPFRPAALVALLLIPFIHTVEAGPTLTLPGAEPFSPTRLATLRDAKQPVFIDLTAAWCVTCLVNERTTLDTPSVRAALTTHHVTLMVGDWTNRDTAITTFLAQNHQAGVPLYLYYPPGRDPITLPQILTPNEVEQALD